VDILEKSLTYRAMLRVIAAKIMNQLGIAQMIQSLDIDLTDLERDNVMRIIYRSKWPDEKPELVANVLGYLAYVKTQCTYSDRLGLPASLCC